ncbi:MAG: hypothetical protein SVU32_04100, partial [Candidatus Nanohaloarchaea archaeon]|nr:hypothetical protein [Candidatus Nanohaloarchaea archaeon]
MNTMEEGTVTWRDVEELFDRYDGTVRVEDRRFPHDESSGVNGRYNSRPGSVELEPAQAQHYLEKEIREVDADLWLELEEAEELYRIEVLIETEDLEDQWFGGRWRRFWDAYGRETPEEHALYRLD